MLRAENLIPRSRLWAVGIVVILSIAILIIRFFYLQIYQHESYSSQSDINRIRAITIPAPRGLILDRNGIILADNYPTYILYGISSEMENKSFNFQTISQTTGIDTAILKKNYKKYYRNRFLPTKLAKDLTITQLSRLEEEKNILQGIIYKQFPERIYSSPVRASHVLGYLKEIDSEYLARKDKDSGLEFGDLIGWSGLEKQYEDLMRGLKGVDYIQVDALGREAGHLKSQENRFPHPGKNLQTTLDVVLQEELEKSLKGKTGVAIVSNPKTGGILAYVSSPDYPPDLFRGLMESQEWNSTIQDTNRPLLNRGTNGTYPPGSIFKMVVAIALLEKNLIDPHWTVHCVGSYEFGDRVFGCWDEDGHGDVNIEQAIVQSCDVYFYKAVQRLDIDDIFTYALRFGYGSETGVDLPSEMQGRVPNRSYMNRRYGRWGWAKGNLLNISIGQGELLVTPLQMVRYINYLAMKGIMFQLHFQQKSQLIPDSEIRLQPKTWSRIHRYMEKTISDVKGTGRAADPRIPGLTLWGKTGTAENPHGEPHAWFVAFGEKSGEMISVVVIIENGGHGGSVAAPIARRVFSKVFSPKVGIAEK